MVASEQHLYQTIVLPRKLATGSILDYHFLLLSPSGYSIWDTENWYYLIVLIFLLSYLKCIYNGFFLLVATLMFTYYELYYKLFRYEAVDL